MEIGKKIRYKLGLSRLGLGLLVAAGVLLFAGAFTLLTYMDIQSVQDLTKNTLNFAQRHFLYHENTGDNGEELDEIFGDYALKKGGMIFVMENASDLPEEEQESIAASEQEAEEAREANDPEYDATPFTFDFDKRHFGLLKCKFDNETLYGDILEQNGYTLGVFFPEHEIFLQRNIVMGFLVAVYVIFLLIFGLVRSREHEKSLSLMNRQYRIIDAISSIYSTILMVDLVKNELEPVNAPHYLLDGDAKTYAADATLEKWAAEYVADAYVEQHRAFMNFATMQERLAHHSHVEMMYQLKSGVWCQTIMIAKRYGENNRVEAILLATRDVSTEVEREAEVAQQLRKSAEEAKRANVAKTDFLRRMSHDIRTPINGIRGMVEIANHFPEDMEKQSECRRKIWEASDFLLDLVNNVLDMNKLESGELVLEEVPFRLDEISKEVATIIRPQAAEQGLKLCTGMATISHYRLIGSPLYLRQILLNLAGNAVKYNRPGGMVEVSGRELESSDTEVLLEFQVTDTGLGMSREFQQHLFEPFSQEHATGRSAYTGTGLGLSITKELIEKMGGSIRFTSEQGVGTTFTVEIPFRIDQSVEEETQDDGEGESLQGVRVLLAEDNDLNREIADFILENEGILVTNVEDGQQAVDTFEHSEPGTFDFILMDVMMPMLDGLEAARRIRKSPHPDAGQIPIFAMTANAFSDDVRRSREAGMNEHVAKPLDSEQLLRLLRRYRRKRGS